MQQMYATTTKSGTAMMETALCREHFLTIEHVVAGLERAEQAEDYDGGIYRDCTGNDALECWACFDPNEETE